MPRNDLRAPRLLLPRSHLRSGDIEQLGADPVLYDSRDLVTHAVIVGMTGSGKTGWASRSSKKPPSTACPVLAIDPKGDLGNLLLTFPNLAAADFRPWIDEEEPRDSVGSVPTSSRHSRPRNGRKVWPRGARTAIGSSEAARAAEFAIYTPGSRAGIPVSILRSFAAPPRGRA